MRTPLALAAFALLALNAGDAASEWTAQQQDKPQQQGQQQQQVPPQQGQPQAALSAGSDHLVGKSVMSAQGKEIGTIKDVLVTPDGKVEALVVTAGGTAGMGGKQVAVTWDKVALKGDQVTVNMSDQEASKLPEYKSD